MTDRPKRILMVSALYHPHVGGTEVHTASVAAELARRGYWVTVATTDTTGDLPALEKIDGVDVVRFKAYPSFTDVYLAPRLWRFVADGSWDLIHVQGYHTAVAPLALAAAKRNPAPVVATFHSGGHSAQYRNLLRPVQSRILGPLLRGADRLVAVSQFEADQFADWLGIDSDSIAVIPNGTNDSDLDPSRVGPEVDSGLTDPNSDDVVILSMGRLVRYKGHHRLIEALPAVIESIPTARLLILGSGPDRDKLERLAAELGVADRVTIDLIPTSERERLYAVMRDSSLAALLSDYESHGMAAHEALAADLPLLVVDQSALGELVEAGLANAVSTTASAEEVAAKVVETIKNPPLVDRESLALGQNWNQVTDRLEFEYDALFGAEGARAAGAVDTERMSRP